MPGFFLFLSAAGNSPPMKKNTENAFFIVRRAPNMMTGKNPLTGMDYPDPDVIRVGDTYYMISTTMHFFPGAEILRSYDLIHWEWCSYVYDTLEHTSGEMLEGENNIYGHGMWAASLRYWKGRFHVIFIAHEWDRTFHFTAENIEGPWEKHYIDGIYHDPSVLFDDDGKVYIVYGNRNIRMTELKEDLSSPKPDGLDRIIIRDAPGDFLGYEGSHIYKIGGKYVLFLIHSRPWKWFRTQACFIADKPDGVWAGGDVLESDLDDIGSGVAQGGIVDTPNGKWYSVMFQDHGAAGRVPVLVPVSWNRFGYPVFGPVCKNVSNESTHPEHKYIPLTQSDDFTDAGEIATTGLKPCWQFNHEPLRTMYQTGNGFFRTRTEKISRTIETARNTITQRTMIPRCTAEVTVDASGIREGDVAGLCMLTGTYALAGITCTDGKYELVMKARDTGKGEETEKARVTADNPVIRIRAEATLEMPNDEVRFLWKHNGKWEQLGPAHRLKFTLDHFCGCRFGLFMYATQETGGEAEFREFRYSVPEFFNA